MLKYNEPEHYSIRIKTKKTVVLRNRKAFMTPNLREKKSKRSNQLKLITSFNTDPLEKIKRTSLSVNTTKHQNFSILRKLSTSNRSKRVLFVIVVRFSQKGRQITKEYVEKLKQAFDRVGKGVRRIEPEAMYRYLQNNPHFEQEATKFITSNSERLGQCLTFRDLLSIVLDEATESQINNMLGWLTEEITPFYDGNRLPVNGRRKMTIKTAQAFQQLFQHIDTDGDGLLSLNEVQTAFEKTVTQQTVTKYFREFDLDGKNKINAMQFIKMVAPHNMDVPHDIIEAAVKT